MMDRLCSLLPAGREILAGIRCGADGPVDWEINESGLKWRGNILKIWESNGIFLKKSHRIFSELVIAYATRSLLPEKFACFLRKICKFHSSF